MRMVLGMHYLRLIFFKLNGVPQSWLMACVDV